MGDTRPVQAWIGIVIAANLEPVLDIVADALTLGALVFASGMAESCLFITGVSLPAQHASSPLQAGVRVEVTTNLVAFFERTGNALPFTLSAFVLAALGALGGGRLAFLIGPARGDIGPLGTFVHVVIATYAPAVSVALSFTVYAIVGARLDAGTVVTDPIPRAELGRPPFQAGILVGIAAFLELVVAQRSTANLPHGTLVLTCLALPVGAVLPFQTGHIAAAAIRPVRAYVNTADSAFGHARRTRLAFHSATSESRQQEEYHHQSPAHPLTPSDFPSGYSS
jgi:hypothetical protein